MAPPPSDTFCILPWTHLFASETGIIYPCCISVDDRLPNVDESGVPYKIYDPGAFTAAWNSSYNKNLRTQMLNGQRPAPCARCFSQEDLGIHSHRKSVNALNKEHISEALAETSQDGSAPMHIRTADLRVGNFCNLKCRMCSPLSTNRIVEEWKLLYPHLKESFYTDLESIDWFEREEFWQLILRCAPELESLNFGGGEPLLIPRVFELMRELVKSGDAKRISLTFNTNLTSLPPEIYELWPNFREVKLMVSVDGFGDVNSYIRYPSKWEKFAANLAQIEKDCARLKIVHLSANVTVQAYNILGLADLLGFFLDNCTNLRYPVLSLLRHPEAMSAQVLPENLRNLAAEKILHFYNITKSKWVARARYSKEASVFEGNIDGVVNFLKGDASQLLPELLRQTEIFDRERNQDVATVIPEFGTLKNYVT